MLCGMKMREYVDVMVFEVNMYYKINLDEDLPIPLIRRGDWRLIFNCKSNYMEQIASDIWLSVWLIKRLGCRGILSAGWIQTKEKIKKSCPVCNHKFQGWNYKAKHPLGDAQHPSTLCLSALLFYPTITAQDPCDTLKEEERVMWEKWTEEVFGSRWSDAPIIYDWHVNDGKVYLLSSSVTSSFWCRQTGREEEEADRRTASQRELLSPRLLLHSSSSLVISP